MLTLLRDLVAHKGHANASLLAAIRRHDAAAHDRELRELLHHIILADRFWLSLILGEPYVDEDESPVPESLDVIEDRYRDTHRCETAWIARAHAADLERSVQTPYIPGQRFSVGQAILQVCLHSHGHRAQCATRLRVLGGRPPAMDFVVWLKERDRSGP